MDELHIIFTDEQVLLSKKAYASWQEIQAEFVTTKLRWVRGMRRLPRPG